MAGGGVGGTLGTWWVNWRANQMGENENEKARDKLHVFLLTPQWARFGSLL